MRFRKYNLLIDIPLYNNAKCILMCLYRHCLTKLDFYFIKNYLQKINFYWKKCICIGKLNAEVKLIK